MKKIISIIIVLVLICSTIFQVVVYADILNPKHLPESHIARYNINDLQSLPYIKSESFQTIKNQLDWEKYDVLSHVSNGVQTDEQGLPVRYAIFKVREEAYRKFLKKYPLEVYALVGLTYPANPSDEQTPIRIHHIERVFLESDRQYCCVLSGNVVSNMEDGNYIYISVYGDLYQTLYPKLFRQVQINNANQNLQVQIDGHDFLKNISFSNDYYFDKLQKIN